MIFDGRLIWVYVINGKWDVSFKFLLFMIVKK